MCVVRGASHSPSRLRQKGSKRRHIVIRDQITMACDHARCARTFCACLPTVTLSLGLCLDLSPMKLLRERYHLTTQHETNAFHDSWSIDVAYAFVRQEDHSPNTTGAHSQRQRTLDIQWRIQTLRAKTTRDQHQRKASLIQSRRSVALVATILSIQTKPKRIAQHLKPCRLIAANSSSQWVRLRSPTSKRHQLQLNLRSR